MIALVALASAVGGGFSMGLYPLFIKTPAVLKAKPHPVVFQLYKSTVVCISGIGFVLVRAIRGETPTVELSYWGFISAAFWVPSGLLTIASVPLIGMGMQMAISSASNSILSFLVFWLVFNSQMKEYSCGKDCVYFRAPIYLTTTVAGMVSLIFARQIATFLGCEKSETEVAEKKKLLVNEEIPEPAKAKDHISFGNLFLGIILSIFCGVFGAAQYAVLTIGKKEADHHYNCTLNSKGHDDCPEWLHEGFDVLGSWWLSFGLGAVGVTLILYAVVCIQGVTCGTGIPSLHWKTLKTAGVAAGSCWVIGNFFITLATVLGGNAIIMAQSQSAQLITSGLFGILWYGEGGGVGSRAFWFMAALWTLASMILLGLEKE